LDEAATIANQGRRPSRGAWRRNEGFVLVLVIWLSGLLAAFAISVTVSVRSHALYARNAVSEIRAKGIADGLVQLTGLRVAHQEAAPPADGRWLACRWPDGAQAWVAVQDQSGLVDLNTASPRLMTALLEGLGMPPSAAEEMVTAMRDFRDADSISDFGRDEPEVYPGRDFGPKNAPFEAVEELDQLPGMTPALFAELRSLTTIHTQQTGFYFGTAPERLLQVLGLTRTSVAGLSFSSPQSSRVRSITVAVQITDSTRFVRHATIERTDQPLRPFVVLTWDGGGWPFYAAQATAVTPCMTS
jgi:type II secretory pathway component PulK